MASEGDDIASRRDAAGYLYGLDADEFVAARDQLVKTLRASGERELAAEVKTLRRPSVTAAELNRVLRTDPLLLDELFAAATNLREGHRELLKGEAVDVMDLQVEHRRAAAALADNAVRDTAKIQTILENASLDEASQPQLREATFEIEPSPVIGFDLFSSLSEGAVTSLDAARAKRSAEARSKPSARSTRSTTAEKATDGPPGEPTQPAKPPPAQIEAAQTQLELPSGRGVDAEMLAAAKERAENSLFLAKRRLDAALKMEATATERVSEMTRRLQQARDHLETSTDKVAEANAAVERAQAAFDEAIRGLDQPEPPPADE